MVRAHVKAPPEEKKESSQRKKPHSKTGLWACRINDCNKSFAREADLKRHQRTTKGHSQPGYACPQCDATFTRTDALRRHQKSRHNGVIVETSTAGNASEDDTDDTDASMSSLSRESSPAQDVKEEPKQKRVSPKPETSSSRVSYYRSQATHPHYGSPLPPPPAIFIEGGYSHAIAIPTSAARLQWPANTPEGSPVPHPSPQLYPVSSYYAPVPYYRYPPPVMASGYPLHYPADTALHLAHHNGGPPPEGYSTQATLTSATRSTQAVESDTNDSGSEVDEGNHKGDVELEPDQVGEESGCTGSHKSHDKANLGLPDDLDHLNESSERTGESTNSAASEKPSRRCEREITPETSEAILPSVEASQERLLPELTLRHKLGVLRRVYAEDTEEDTLSPRMREVALDEPLMTMGQESLPSLRA